MWDIVTDEQRRDPPEAGLPFTIYSVSAKVRRFIEGALSASWRRPSITYSRYAHSSPGQTPQNRPAICQGIGNTTLVTTETDFAVCDRPGGRGRA